MANTHHQMYIQTVFAVKFRHATIAMPWRSKLMGVVGNLINETGCKTIIVNGTHDHIHCFFGLKPDLAVSVVMQGVKAKSSKWINENHHVNHRFEWQKSFGSFSYSRSHIDKVYQYILNQEKHHEKKSFRKEYMQMLDKYHIQYDERYIFKDLI